MIEILPFVYHVAPYVENALKLREFFQDKAADLLAEIGSVHIESFRQAMVAADVSQDFATEVRVGIGHLRDSFNFFGAALQKRRLFIFGQSDSKTMKLYKKRTMVAAMIALAYGLVGDKHNEKEWANTSLRELDEYGKIYIEIGHRMDIHPKGIDQFGDLIGETDYEAQRQDAVFRESSALSSLLLGRKDKSLLTELLRDSAQW